MKQTKILLINQSTEKKTLLQNMISKIDEVTLLSTSPTPAIALIKIANEKPDFIVMDIQSVGLTSMDFIEIIEKDNQNVGIIVIGSENPNESESLQLVDILNRKDYEVIIDHGMTFDKTFHDALMQTIISRIRIFHTRRLTRTAKNFGLQEFQNQLECKEDNKLKIENNVYKFGKFYKIIVIGLSTGGPKALLEIIQSFPKELIVPVVIILHMPQYFIYHFIELLSKKSKLPVKIAEDDEILKPATIYLARGDRHLVLNQNTSLKYIFNMNDNGKVNNCKPSVDVFFKSVAGVCKDKSIAVIMTGMGEDGARGIALLKEAGSKTIAQDKESSVVWGMPGAAVKTGAIDNILPLDKIVSKILYYLETI